MLLALISATAMCSVPMMMLGVFILWIGWFGFNPGSQLGADFPIVSDVAVTTVLAGAAGAMTAMIYTWARHKKPDVSMTGNGALPGLVAITAGCVFVYPWAAVLIGALAGLAGAVSGTLLGRAARGPGAPAPSGFARGLAEDAVAAGLAVVLVTSARARQRRSAPRHRTS